MPFDWKTMPPEHSYEGVGAATWWPGAQAELAQMGSPSPPAPRIGGAGGDGPRGSARSPDLLPGCAARNAHPLV